jgi:hypothetical protein
MDLTTNFDLVPNPVRDEALRPRRDRGPRDGESIEQFIERCTDTVHPTERAGLVARIRRYQDRALTAYHEGRYSDWNQLTERAHRLMPDAPDSTLPAVQAAGGTEGSRSRG